MLRLKGKLSSIFFLLILVASFSTNCESSEYREKRGQSRSPPTNSPPQSPPSPSEWSLYVEPESSSHSSKRSNRSRSTVKKGIWQDELHASERSADWVYAFLQHAHKQFTSVPNEAEKIQEYERNVTGKLDPEQIETKIINIENDITSDISYFVRWEERKRENVRIGITPTYSPHPLLEQCNFTVLIQIAFADDNVEWTMNPQNDKVTDFRNHELFRNEGCGTFLHIKSNTSDPDVIHGWYEDKSIGIYVAALIINFNVLNQTVNVFGVGLGGNVASIAMDAFRQFSAGVALIKFDLIAINPEYHKTIRINGHESSLIFATNALRIAKYVHGFDKVTIIFTTEPVPRIAGSPDYLKLCVTDCRGTDPIWCYIVLRQIEKVSIRYRSKHCTETVSSAFSAIKYEGFVDVTLDELIINFTLFKYMNSLESKTKKKRSLTID